MPELEEEQVYPNVHKKLVEEKEADRFGTIGWHVHGTALHDTWARFWDTQQAQSRMHRPTPIQPYTYHDEFIQEAQMDSYYGEQRMREWQRRQARRLEELQEMNRPRHHRLSNFR